MIRFLPLKKVCKQIVDCPHESPEWLREGITVIRNFNLVDGQLDLSDRYCVDEETYEKRIKRAVPSDGDIIFSREAPIGNCAIIPPNTKCCLGQRLVLLRVDTDVCSSEYLLAALQSQYVKQQIEQVSKSGSIVSNFNISDLKELIIPVVSQQETVSNISATLNRKVRTNKEIIDSLEAVAKTLYDYWFVQFDFPDENGKPYRTSGGEMEWNAQLKREIPKGWNVKAIIDEFDVCYGYPFDTTKFTENEDGISIIRIRDILENTTSAKTLEIVDEKYKVNRGDLIVGMDGNFHMNFWSGHPALLNQRCFKISSLGYSVLIAYFSAKPYIKAREKNVTRTTVGHLSANDVQALSVLVPTEPEKRKFSAIFDDILNKICQTRRENEELTKLRDWLLPLLMNGQARVE